jgi:glycosyltransferase involved in cell wall biosynthesis
VVTPAYNEQDYLPNLITALSNQTYRDIELIVVDNVSTDGTVALARSMGAQVVVNPEYNLSKSRNMGASTARGKILCFIDADSFPEQVGIERTVAEIEKGAVMVPLNQCCWDSPFQSSLRLTRGWVFGHLATNGNYMGVTKEAYKSLGGFNEDCLPQYG